MTRRAEIAPRLPWICGLPIPEAAASIGVSESHFRSMQSRGLMPRPRDMAGKLVIDVEDLHRAFKALPYAASDAPGSAPLDDSKNIVL